MELLGERHPDALMSMNNLGYTLSRQGNYALLEEVNFQTLEPSEKQYIEPLKSPKSLESTEELLQIQEKQVEDDRCCCS